MLEMDMKNGKESQGRGEQKIQGEATCSGSGGKKMANH